MPTEFDERIAEINASYEAARIRIDALSREAGILLQEAGAPPGARELVREAVMNPQVNRSNFIGWVKSKMPSLCAPSKANVIDLMLLAFGISVAVWMTSQPVRDQAVYGTCDRNTSWPPQEQLQPLPDMPNMRINPWSMPDGTASCDGESVVDAVFAKAEAKAEAKARQR